MEIREGNRDESGDDVTDAVPTTNQQHNQKEKDSSASGNGVDEEQQQEAGSGNSSNNTKQNKSLSQQIRNLLDRTNDCLRQLLPYMCSEPASDVVTTPITSFMPFFEQHLPQFYIFLFSQVKNCWSSFMEQEFNTIRNAGLFYEFLQYLMLPRSASRHGPGTNQHEQPSADASSDDHVLALDVDATLLWQHLLKENYFTENMSDRLHLSQIESQRLWKQYQKLKKFRETLFYKQMVTFIPLSAHENHEQDRETDTIHFSKRSSSTARQSSQTETEFERQATEFGLYCHKIWFPDYYKTLDTHEQDQHGGSIFGDDFWNNTGFNAQSDVWEEFLQDSSNESQVGPPPMEDLVLELESICLRVNAEEFLPKLKLVLEEYHSGNQTSSQEESAVNVGDDSQKASNLPYFEDRSYDLTQQVVRRCVSLYESTLKPYLHTTHLENRSSLDHLEQMIQLLVNMDADYFIHHMLKQV